MKTAAQKDRPTAASVREQLRKIVASAPFVRAERMKRFLEYTVEQMLKGQASSLKEYSIALNAYDRSPEFDPRLDPIIRVEASRLRDKLREYYDTVGRSDPIHISLPKRSYKPTFQFSGKPLRATPDGNSSSTEAERLYLKGRYYWNKRTPKALAQAIECFDAAVSIRTDFALAHAGLGDSYASLAWLESSSPNEAWPKALGAAECALRDGSRLAQALTTLACGRALYHWDWDGAEEGFREAIDADETYATARHWYAMFCLAPQRRLDEAVSELKRARALDPASAIISCHLGRILHYQRRYEEAIEELHGCTRMDPTLYLAYWHMGLVFATLSQLKDAKEAFARAYKLSQNSLTITGMGYIHALTGNSLKAGDAITHLQRLQTQNYVSAFDFALIASALGDVEGVFRHLHQSIAERAPRVVHLKVDPAFDVIKPQDRFLHLLALLKIPD